jgi:NADH-quinone oxidoreductase subunit H
MLETFQLLPSLILPHYLTIVKVILFDLAKIIMLLVAIAYYTLAERKIMAAAQRRKGPNVVGLYGLLQPLADGVKLLLKELLIPTAANSRIFIFAPLSILALSLLSWIVITMGITDYNGFRSYSHSISDDSIIITSNFISKFILGSEYLTWMRYTFNDWCSSANINYAILFLLAISSLNVYGIIIAGWASNSKYAFLGSLRSAAQMISYEVSIGLVILPVIMLAGSLNFTQIIFAQQCTIWYGIPLLPCAIIFFISMLAETNRTPFDLTEAEAELVAGYNTEYSSIIFAMFFLAEYSNMILMSTIFSTLFLGGWLMPFNLFNFVPPYIIFSIKIILICFLFVIVRATLPRYRYDQLMNIGWKFFLPISLSYLFFCAGLLLTFDAFPFILEFILEPSL